MRKTIILIALAISSQLSQAQTLSQFVERFSKAENAEVVNLTKAMLQEMVSLAAQAAENESEADDDEGETDLSEAKEKVLDYLDQIDVISMENCSETDRIAFCEAATKLEPEGVELLVDAMEDGEHAKIYGSIDGNICKELIVMSLEANNPVFVRVTGNLDLEMLKGMKDFNLVNINGVKFPQ